jgi:CP family cyanate transporter-like MFS transporter
MDVGGGTGSNAIALATRYPHLRFTLVDLDTGVMLAPVPGWVWVGAVVLGLGQGWGFGLAMTLIGLRAKDTSAAVGLSGMAQGIGYAISGLGPFATGLLHSAAGSWTATFTMVAAVCVAQLVIGLGAGRPSHVRL